MYYSKFIPLFTPVLFPAISIFMEMKEDHILVYFDDHFEGYEFFYKDVKNNRAVVSKLVYDDEDECEDSAYLCLFSQREERDELGFLKHKHCEVVSIH